MAENHKNQENCLQLFDSIHQKFGARSFFEPTKIQILPTKRPKRHTASPMKHPVPHGDIVIGDEGRKCISTTFLEIGGNGL